MIIQNLKIFLQNIQKNRLLTDVILENNKKLWMLLIILHKLSFQDIQTLKTNILESLYTLTFDSFNYVFSQKNYSLIMVLFVLSLTFIPTIRG